MKISKSLIALVLSFSFPLSVFAVVGVTSSELQSAVDIIVPSGSSLEPLAGYEDFTLQNTANISGGISALYDARLSSNQWLNDEMPQLKLLVFTYANQETAENTFNKITKKNIDKNSRWLFYEEDPGVNVDVFNSITTEEKSLHLIHLNGNLIFQASIYRSSGEYDRKNVETFANAMTDYENTRQILEDAIEEMKLSLGILFPPTTGDFSAKSDKSSFNLSELYEVPSHGQIDFKLYVGRANSSLGTIFDSSGISAPTAGDIYLYLQKDGTLMAGIYAPDLDSDCEQNGGWYRIKTEENVFPYEWNNFSLHYGVGGFWISRNGKILASCKVSQAKSGNDLYFGDFPTDSIEESMVGTIKDLDFVQSKTDSGLIWDEVLENQLFLDLPNSDSNLNVFQFLKEKNVFTGSDGMLYPDNILNRVEMVKILLKAYDVSIEDGSVPFWDVPKNVWYEKYLASAYKIGMVKGHEDGRFLPGHEINRAEFFTMLYRISGVKKLSYKDEFPDVNPKDWYANGASFASKYNLISDTEFNASKTISRREAGIALYNLLK